MRRTGVSPRVVFIDLDHDASSDGGWPALWPANCPHRAHVEIADDELLSSLDMRFTAGLKVLVTCKDMTRGRKVATACLEAGASELTVVDHVGNMEHRIQEPV